MPATEYAATASIPHIKHSESRKSLQKGKATASGKTLGVGGSRAGNQLRARERRALCAAWARRPAAISGGRRGARLLGRVPRGELVRVQAGAPRVVGQCIGRAVRVEGRLLRQAPQAPPVLALQQPISCYELGDPFEGGSSSPTTSKPCCHSV